METAFVRTTGELLQKTAERIEQNVNKLSNVGSQLESTWQGNSSHSFKNESHTTLQNMRYVVGEGRKLGLRVQREVEQWEQTDASLNSGGTSGSILDIFLADNFGGRSTLQSIPSELLHPPDNPAKLFDLIRADSDNQPVKLIQIRENEFLVTIAGTNGWNREEN